jgi:hypothetical protein
LVVTQRQGEPNEAPGAIGSLPGWTPESVIKIIRQIEQPDLNSEQRTILRRLVLDPRMQKVWSELLKRDRSSGNFVHPARRRHYPHLRSKNELQQAALSEIFHLAFCAARDRIRVSKFQEILQNKKLLLENASRLRILAGDLDLARSTGQFGVSDPISQELAANDVAALVSVAKWLEHLASALRRKNDPLIVKRHRSDDLIRGVQIIIANGFYEIFGKRLGRSAATLAGVGLDAKTSASTARSVSAKKKSKHRKPR